MLVGAGHLIVADRATHIISNGLFEAGETSVGAPAAGLGWHFAEGVVLGQRS